MIWRFIVHKVLGYYPPIELLALAAYRIGREGGLTHEQSTAHAIACAKNAEVFNP